MNIHPLAGDTWTKPGESETLEVLTVTADQVVLRQFALPLSEYLDLAAATVRNGGKLHRTEPEDPLFE